MLDELRWVQIWNVGLKKTKSFRFNRFKIHCHEHVHFFLDPSSTLLPTSTVNIQEKHWSFNRSNSFFTQQIFRFKNFSCRISIKHNKLENFLAKHRKEFSCSFSCCLINELVSYLFIIKLKCVFLSLFSFRINNNKACVDRELWVVSSFICKLCVLCKKSCRRMKGKLRKFAFMHEKGISMLNELQTAIN